MSIYTAASTTFTADVAFGPFYTGLAGTIGVEILDSTGAITIAHTTSGITESPAGSGAYICTFSGGISSLGSYRAVWDTGGVTPNYAIEDVYVVVDVPGTSPPPSGINLCTLTDIHTQGEVTGTGRDTLYNDLIPIASQEITRYTRRLFYDLGSQTLRFRVDSRYVDLDPYDLRSVTTVNLNPESSAPQTLSTPFQYVLEPVNAPWGTYQTLHLSNSNIAWYSTTLINYGYALVDVTGNWGFASVPIDVVRACVITILSWTDRSQASYGAGDLLDDTPRAVQPSYESAYAIPPGARRILAKYMRNPIRPGGV